MCEASDFVAEHAEELRDYSSPSGIGFNPESLGAVASHVVREYGYTGYSILPIVAAIGGSGLYEVRHYDGSTFRLWGDRYGNVARVPDAVTA